MRTRSFAILAAAVFVALSAGVLWAGGSVDKHIQDLKSSDPDVRAKAAYELGCG
ncbi:MAG: hypothetical protein AB1733_09625 [Thermodesulfobacteriota bacterium]